MQSNQFILFSEPLSPDNPCILNYIHQEIINLDFNPPKNEIQRILEDAISHIDKKLDIRIAIELFNLIFSCLSFVPDQSDEFYKSIYDDSQKSSNRLILFAKIFSKKQNIPLSIQKFVQDIMTQITNQIQQQKETIIINNHEIHPSLLIDFIIDVVLMSNLDEMAVSVIYSFIFSQPVITNPNIKEFSLKVMQKQFLKAIPEIALTNQVFFQNVPQEFLSILLSKSTKSTFQKVIPFFHNLFILFWAQPIATSILHKSEEFDYDIKSDSKLFSFVLDSLQPTMMNPLIWHYFEKYHIKLPKKVANKITEFSNPVAALKVMPDINKIPVNIVIQALLDTNDLLLFELVTEYDFSNINGDQLSQKKFWTHLLSVVSSSERKYSESLMKLFVNAFDKYVDKNKSYEIIEAMFFNDLHMTENGKYFLISFVDGLKNKDLFQKNVKTFFQKIVECKVLPQYSFWRLFICGFNEQFYKESNNSLNDLCEFEFSHQETATTTIIIKPVDKKESQKHLIDFIKNKDLDLIEIDEDSLRFIISILLYINNESKLKIRGVTKETILPFLAISLKYVDKDKYDILLPKSTEFANLLLRTCKFLPKTKSPLLIESINEILSCNDYLFYLLMFPDDFSFQIFNNLINQLIDDIYNADKLILLRAIFTISKEYLNNEHVKFLFNKNGINLYKFIIQNRLKIPNFDSLLHIGLCSHVFKLKQISTFLAETIENSAVYDEVVNTICFIQNIYTNCPKLKITKTNNVFKCLNDAINKSKWDDFCIIEQFIKKYELENEQKKILYNKSHLSYIKMITLKIIADSQPEKNNSFIEYLFEILMSDFSIANEYISILLEKITINQKIEPKLILENYKKLYDNNKSIFMNALGSLYKYSSNAFIRKLSSLNDNSFNMSKVGFSLVSILLDEASKQSGSFQAFFCLKNIASSFPFLFSNNPTKIFKTVLPALNSFSLILTIQNENLNANLINKIKITLAALYFLISALHSVKVLESFVPWIYKKITSLSQEQILAFSYVLISLFETPKVNEVMLALSSKLSLPSIACKLLEIEVQEVILQCYKTNIYIILTKFYQMLFDINSKNEIIYVDELKKMKNPFQYSFSNNSTIYPQKMKPLNLPIPKINEINNFVKEINAIRSFWLDFENYEEVNCEDVLQFIFAYNKNSFSDSRKKAKNNDNEFFEIHVINKIGQIRYLAKQPVWIFNYIVRNERFILPQEHFNELRKVAKDLNNLSKKEEANPSYDNVNIYHFFSSDFCQKDLLYLLFKDKFSGNSYKNEQLNSLIGLISRNSDTLKSILEILSDNINQTIESIYCLKMILKNIISMKQSYFNNFQISFSDEIGKKMIDTALLPENRKDESLLELISDFSMFVNNLPDCTQYLVYFMISNNQKACEISKLCKKISISCCKNILQNLIRYLLLDKSNKRSYYYTIFNNIIEIDPLQIKIDVPKAHKILDEAISLYKSEIWLKDVYLDFIFNLLNTITPKRSEINIIDIQKDDSPSSIKDMSLMKKAHPDLIKTNPDFWNLYNSYLPFINKIVTDDEKYFKKLFFLQEYPELMNIRKRISDFRKKMNKKIDTNKTIKIKVNRFNILPDSFTFLKNKSQEDWLSQIRVEFNGEWGIDAGGLTKNWFSLVVKEIFNPNFALFSLTENKNYQPNPLSRINQEHIEYFRFAGKLIARSIIQGQCVDAHFSRPFCRQILHSQCNLSDFEDVDENIYRSLQTILNEDVEPLGLNFTIDVDEYGVIKNVLLKENGDKIDVTNENKKEYVNLYVDYRLRKSMINQIEAFCEGFNWLIPINEINNFTPNELDLIICGNKKIDINDLRENTYFTFPYTADHPVIKMFFNVLSRWDSENLSKFLMFLTGSSQVPVNGFKEYKENGKQIKIAPGGNKDRLCVAHTCFNILDLPEYENEDELNSKLLQSIQECQFGLG
ncbi:hypothetical protein M9Y10_024834 [Tritrichomonas musculus]|uniref:HECT-type E3 ubiquitin transferase n=1 Tax=Tritrichomonas musculus TaxID=1915356 RepID=A0ABR2HCB1_9EUKA